MRDPQKPSNTNGSLSQLEEALVQTILNASGDELRAEIKENGEDPEKYIELIESALADAKSKCARRRLDKARAQAAAFKAQKYGDIVSFDKSAAKARPGITDTCPSVETMLAARKGKQLSKRDEDALSRARIKLQKLESKSHEDN